ncbi:MULTISPECIES: hypothetical protein [unclassified Streptomyces]|uniref:hypothetical protein n=1 Tax=unclassified Streptomyces TaxID=2593676 RepID=UPI0029B4547C|nr:hypothetical protein [Streptomyces sp. AK02-01A]MDX3852511.1 hypothetical protein [Streptomyces sp. AK02-01A]
MIWEALGSVLLGLGLSWAAARRLPHRLPARRTVFITGPVGALFGAYLTHMALGAGHVLATLGGALLVGAVLLSLLLRPASRRLSRALP